MAESTPRVLCPSCKAVFRWAPAAAGRKVACKCGAVIRFPKEPGGEVKIERPSPPKTEEPLVELPLSELAAIEEVPAGAAVPDSDSYDLSLDDTDKAAITGACPSCGKAVKPNAVICLECGYNLQSGQKIQTALGENVTPPTKAGKVAPAGKKAAKGSGEPGGMTNFLRIVGFISNAGVFISGILFAIGGGLCCGLPLCFLFTSLAGLNIKILANRGADDTGSFVLSIIGNAILLIVGLLNALGAILIVTGASFIANNPQFQQAQAGNQSPGFMLFAGLMAGGIALSMILAAASSFTYTMMIRKSG